MKIKIKSVDGDSTTIDVEDSWTVQRLSLRHCNGQALASGFPPKPLRGSSLLSEVLHNGDVVRVLNDWMNETTERIMRKRAKRRQKKAERESLEIVATEETKYLTIEAMKDHVVHDSEHFELCMDQEHVSTITEEESRECFSFIVMIIV